MTQRNGTQSGAQGGDNALQKGDAGAEPNGEEGMAKGEGEAGHEGQEEDVEPTEEDEGRDEESSADAEVHKTRMNKLQYLLQRSQVYSRIMSDKMRREKEARQQKEKKAARAEEEGQGSGRAKRTTNGRTTRAGEAGEKRGAAPVQRREQAQKAKRQNEEGKYLVSDYIAKEDVEDEKGEGANQADKKGAAGQHADLVTTSFKQPDLVTGATLRDYQLYGVEWLIGLYENGLNGILADEMGLGKTLQTIAFLAHLKSKHQYGPFIVVCPTSTLQNWMDEIARFAPKMRGLLYHSSDKKQRKRWIDAHRHEPRTAKERLEFPIFVTSYEIAINDSRLLGSMRWKFIVVDEGHRLKNKNARLTRELKSYYSANRLILTGTPVHNNLAELWSLLNFILPDVFDNLEEFERWFDFSELQAEGGSARLLSREQSQHIISTLRDILDPFILQREKKHVEKDLPPKKEYMLYAPLTLQQKELYEEVLNNSIRARLAEMQTGMPWAEILATGVHQGGGGWDPPLHGASRMPNQGRARDTLRRGAFGSSEPSSGASTPSKRSRAMENGFNHIQIDDGPRKARRNRRSGVDYNVDAETEKQFMDRMEEGEAQQGSRRAEDHGDVAVLSAEDVKQHGKEHAVRQAQKEIANMRLLNPVMQLRKICGHPFLLYWPRDPQSGEHLANEQLIHASGKMMMLNRLLDALWSRGHKVLLFSQFTTMLDIIEDWVVDFKKVTPFRIDGSVDVHERSRLMKRFNSEKGPDACKLFLLSTRSGGLGVNLVGADTVIFYDTDWNPQVDRQAQDRAHRIGQTKPVLVFRLVTRDTAEERIVKRAFAKQQLSTLVMSGDQFSKQTTEAASAFASGRRANASSRVEEWTALLDDLKRESVQFEVADKHSEMISDEHLEMLLDRSPATFERRTTGWSDKAEGKDAGSVKTASGKSAFEVTDVLQAMEKQEDDVEYDPRDMASALGDMEEV